MLLEELQRDLTLEPVVHGQVHDAHTPGSELLEHAKTPEIGADEIVPCGVLGVLLWHRLSSRQARGSAQCLTETGTGSADQRGSAGSSAGAHAGSTGARTS